jgi:hypothetical protein
MSKAIPFLGLLAALAFLAYTLGHYHGLSQGDGLGRIAKANDRLAASYEALAAQMARINP